MTEEEARKKWCPFVRIIETDLFGAQGTRYWDEDNEINTTCIGSECMAWRWTSTSEMRDAAQNDIARGAVDSTRHTERYFSGYCGLAGTLK